MVGEGLETDDLLHTGTLWPKSDAVANQFGEVRSAAPCEIECRFSINSNTKNDPQSAATQAIGKVYVDREVSLGSILRKGTIKKPESKTFYEVVGYNEKDDVFCDNTRRWVDVALWHGQLPDGV